MFDNTNPYILWEEEYEDFTRYYISMKDVDGKQQVIELSESVYLELRNCNQN